MSTKDDVYEAFLNSVVVAVRVADDEIDIALASGAIFTVTVYDGYLNWELVQPPSEEKGWVFVA